jgi:hypothetical protein
VIWNGSPRRTVFLLGAGATRGAFSHVRVHGKKLLAPLNGDFFDVVESFVAAQGNSGGFKARYDRVRKVFLEEFPTRGRWPIPMEEAFSLLYVSKDFPEIYLPRHGRRRRPGSRREIEDFLRLTFGILSAIEEHVGHSNLYAQLVSKLGPGDTILTLNYDTLLDSALVTAGWDPAKGYGLMGGSGKIRWTRPHPESSASLANVRLLKLHGSLNWYVRGSFSNLSQIFEKKPSKIVISETPRVNEFTGFVRQIAPPIYGKFFGHKHWRTLWTAAHDALVEAEMLVIIGCSLVDTDFHLSGMLSHAVKERKSAHRPFRLVVAVDRTRVRRKWLRLLRGCALAIRPYSSFEKFAFAQLTH